MRDVQPKTGRAVGPRGTRWAVSPGQCSFRARRAGLGGADTGKLALSEDCPSGGTVKGTVVAVPPALAPALDKSAFPGVSLVPPELPAHHQRPGRVPERVCISPLRGRLGFLVPFHPDGQNPH